MSTYNTKAVGITHMPRRSLFHQEAVDRHTHTSIYSNPHCACALLTTRQFLGLRSQRHLNYAGCFQGTLPSELLFQGLYIYVTWNLCLMKNTKI